jgi:PDDEXK-like domain of unknown function (DUF3799)
MKAEWSPEPGLYLDIPPEQYHSGPGVSRSDLVKILRSPAHFKYGEQEETDAMVFGEDFHAALLEPQKFKDSYVVLPEECRRGSGKGQQERKAVFEAEAAAKGQTVIKEEDRDTILGMIAEIRKHDEIAPLLSEGQSEVSGYWYDPLYPEILLKIRLDHINMKTGIVLDPKSTTDSREGYWVKKAFDMKYHIQAAMYLAGLSTITGTPHRDFRFIVVEKKKPYGVQWYQAQEDFIQLGEVEFRKAVAIYAECLHKNEWPCYSPAMKPLGLPGWVRRSQEIYG